ncbi:MAG TPA: lysophospholipid acyltransferase family protein [Syntrophales bacterium]|nr:lysophospholipid acyltransferase family protein [Syntrophales bacterium]
MKKRFLKWLGRKVVESSLVISLAHSLIRGYLSLVRLEVIGEERMLSHLRGGGKAIAALWHQRVLGVVGYASRFREFKPSAIVSASRDGDLIVRIVERLNFRPVRGSSTRGGREALSAMVEDLREHPFAVHASDGPTGPRGVIKAGLIRMSQLSGAPVVPVYISFSRAWSLGSWDRMLIPKPFSRIVVRWGEPMYVPKNLDVPGFEGLRQNMERSIREEQDRDDRRWGWKNLLLEGH